MLVIYDLDKTSLYCPIADFMDRFIPEDVEKKKLYYRLYNIVYAVEMFFGLLKINKQMYHRAKNFSMMPNVHQIVVTARHYSLFTRLHAQKVFKDVFNDMELVCIAQGITGLSKAEVVSQIYPTFNNILMYDDSRKELGKMKRMYKKSFTGKQVRFLNDKREVISDY